MTPSCWLKAPGRFGQDGTDRRAERQCPACGVAHRSLRIRKESEGVHQSHSDQRSVSNAAPGRNKRTMSSNQSDGAVVTGAASGIGRGNRRRPGYRRIFSRGRRSRRSEWPRAPPRKLPPQTKVGCDLPARRRDGPVIGQCRHRCLYTPIRLDQGDGQQRWLQQAGTVPRGRRPSHTAPRLRARACVSYPSRRGELASRIPRNRAITDAVTRPRYGNMALSCPRIRSKSPRNSTMTERCAR